MIVTIELVSLYIVYYYSNDIEVYILVFRVGMSFLMISVGDRRICGILVMLIIWPILGVYVTLQGRLIEGLKINRIKLMVSILVVMRMSAGVISLMYLTLLGLARPGLIRTLLCSFYACYMMINGVPVLMSVFGLVYSFINCSYKYIAIGLLPLPIFYLKTGRILILYVGSVISMFVFIR
jgi:hypothetical protein